MEALDDHDDVQHVWSNFDISEEGDRGLARVRVFGIDPGSERTGYGCVGDRRVAPPDCHVRRHPRSPLPLLASPTNCSRFTSAAVIAALSAARLRGDREPVLLGQRPQRAQARARARRGDAGRGRGVALPIVEYTPAEIKRAVVGYGRAEKPQVQQMVKLLLGLAAVPSPHDAADALAVAICHVHSQPPMRARSPSAGA